LIARDEIVLAVAKVLLKMENGRCANSMAGGVGEWDDLGPWTQAIFWADAEAALDAAEPWIAERERAAFYQGVSRVTDADPRAAEPVLTEDDSAALLDDGTP
jgi:hypothetical protein